MSDKIPHLLSERGRYYYQRRVPLTVQEAVGHKKWREPVGADFIAAVDRVRALTMEHDELLQRLSDPSAFQDHKSVNRRHRETIAAAKENVDELRYRRWLTDQGMEDASFFGEDEDTKSIMGHVEKTTWVYAMDALAGIEKLRRQQTTTQLKVPNQSRKGAGQVDVVIQPRAKETIDEDEYYDHLLFRV